MVGAVADGRDAAAAAAAARSAVVLMDFRLPGLDGAGATAAVLAAAPNAAVVCLTAEATEADREAVLAAGAVGLIEKGRSIEDLVAAIHVATGRAEPAA